MLQANLLGPLAAFIHNDATKGTRDKPGFYHVDLTLHPFMTFVHPQPLLFAWKSVFMSKSIPDLTSAPSASTEQAVLKLANGTNDVSKVRSNNTWESACTD